MSLQERLEKKAVDTIGDGHWVESVAEKIKAEGEKRAVLKPVANDVADDLMNNKEAIGKLSAYGFLSVVSRLGLGDDEEARLIYLHEEANFDERMAALDTASEATRARKEADDKAKEEAWEIVKSIGKALLAGLKEAAVPLLMAVI